jgi:hypothetical protein
MALPKVLVCAPTSIYKDYCFKEWIENVMNFTYPNFDIFLCDNSPSIDYSISINKYVSERYGKLFFPYHYPLSHHTLVERIAFSHDMCRHILVSKDYDYMLHLETDVFPQTDIIERLLWNNKEICGAVYYTDEGANRKPVLQRIVELSDNKEDIVSLNFEPTEDLGFMDGEVKQVGHVGLGCVLIKKEVFANIEFRCDLNLPEYSADSFFANDCYDQNIPIFADTSLVVKHKNKKWIDLQ